MSGLILQRKDNNSAMAWCCLVPEDGAAGTGVAPSGGKAARSSNKGRAKGTKTTMTMSRSQ